MLNAHVEEVIVEGGRARGVSLRGGSRVLASKAVVSNASLWDTQRLLPASEITPSMRQAAAVRECFTILSSVISCVLCLLPLLLSQAHVVRAAGFLQ